MSITGPGWAITPRPGTTQCTAVDNSGSLWTTDLTDRSGTDTAAGPLAQVLHVVSRRTGRLGGIGHHPEVARRGQTTFVRVQDVQPGQHGSVQRLHPQPELLVQAE